MTPGEPRAAGEIADDPLLDDPEVAARAVRRKAAIMAAVTLPIVAIVTWALSDGSSAWLGWAILALGGWRIGRVWLRPLDYLHLARPNPIRAVLEAGGLPERADGVERSSAERRLAVQEYHDQVACELEGFWATRPGRLLLKTGGLLGVAFRGVLGVVMVVVGGAGHRRTQTRKAPPGTVTSWRPPRRRE